MSAAVAMAGKDAVPLQGGEMALHAAKVAVETVRGVQEDLARGRKIGEILVHGEMGIQGHPAKEDHAATETSVGDLAVLEIVIADVMERGLSASGWRFQRMFRSSSNLKINRLKRLPPTFAARGMPSACLTHPVLFWRKEIVFMHASSVRLNGRAVFLRLMMVVFS